MEHPTRTRAGAPAAYLGSFVAMGMSTMLLGPSLRTLAHGAGTTTAELGILFTAGSLGYLVGVSSAGRLITRRRGHAVLAFGLLLMGSGIALFPLVHGVAGLFGIEFALSVGIGFVEIPCNSLILWTRGGGSLLQALHASWSIGAVLAPLIVGRSLAWTGGLRLGYTVVALACAVPLFALRGSVSPPNPHVDAGHGIPEGTRGLIAIGTLFYFAYIGLELAFAGWIYEYAHARGFSNGVTTYVGAAFLGAFAVGRIAGVGIARRVDAMRVLHLDHALAAVALVVLLAGGSNALALWVGTALFGLGLASMFGTMLAVSERHVPPTGTVTSIYLVGSSIGGMTLPGGMGALIDRFGPATLPLVCGAFSIVTWGCVVAFEVTATRRALQPSS